MNRFLKIGHRGAKKYAVENTLDSFKKAINFGVNAIEFDVRQTKDGKIVILHDDNLKRVFGVEAFLKNLTLKEVKLLTNNQIPTLEEAIKFINGKIAKILIEIKERDITDKVVSIVKKMKFVHRVVIISFHKEVVKRVKEINKNIETGWIYVKEKQPLQVAKNLKVNYVIPFYRFCHSKNISNFHREKIKVIVWTINNLKDIKTWMKKGVDGVASDDPVLFKKLKF